VSHFNIIPKIISFRRFQVNERQIVTDQRDSGIANTSGSSGSSLKKKKACVIM
jgi:hypothetical protein